MDKSLIEMKNQNSPVVVVNNSGGVQKNHHLGHHVLMPSMSNDQTFAGGCELSWQKISVWTKPARRKFFCRRSNEQPVQILDSISGKIEPGQLLAVMGPSGSGKTTLLNTLTGRNLSQFQCEGNVMINKQRARNDLIKSVSGYVQQGDLFVPMLTVKEYLIFVSLVRMDASLPAQDRHQRVDEILDELELQKVANCRIGNRNDDLVGTGISGGELRRLSFAGEMLHNPALLFCDEPTSGLDSTLAENVVKILKKMAQSGRTIICTIHQPSSEVFILFDRLLLLSQGKLAFMGTLPEATEFFSSMNMVCPSHFNPADFYLKQISIIPGAAEESLQRINQICSRFQHRIDNVTEDIDDAAELAADNGHNGQSSSTESLPNAMAGTAKNSVYKTSWFEQFKALLWRSFISTIREPMLIRIKLSQTLTVALLLGLVYWRQDLDQKGIMNINGAIFIIIINLTFMNVFSVINTFCSELPLFVREHNNGMYRVAPYFFAKMFSELPYQILMPTIFIIILYFMIGFNNSVRCFEMFILIANLITGCSISFGYMISSMSSSTKMAIALSSPLILPLLLFGGFFLNNSTIPAFFKIFKYVSWFYYGNEALIISQWRDVRNITCPERPLPINETISLFDRMQSGIGGEQRCLTTGLAVIEELSFNPDHLYLDLAALVIIIFVMRLIAFLCLALKSKIR